MSVTFSIESLPTDTLGWAVTCADRLDCPTGIFSYDDACSEGTTHAASCEGEMCSYYGSEVREVLRSDVREDLSVNVSNRNAGALLGLLGVCVDEELYGAMSAEDFLGRAQVALAICPTDEGLPARTLVTDDLTSKSGDALPGALVSAGVAVVDMGRPAGYYDRVLGALADLAVAARQVNRAITWA